MHQKKKSYCFKLHKHPLAVQSTPGFVHAIPSSPLSLELSSFIVSSGNCALTSLTNAIPFILTLFEVLYLKVNIWLL